MAQLCGDVPVDAVFAGYDGRGRGEEGREKLFLSFYLFMRDS